jgi:hypothetical protein
MKLYPIRPDVGAVTAHFKQMSEGRLPGRGAQVGYGMLGSRLRFSGHSLVKRPKSDNRPVIVKQVTAAEQGLQQAKSELAAAHARKRGIKRGPRSSSSQSRSKKQPAKKKKKKRQPAKKKSTQRKKKKNTSKKTKKKTGRKTSTKRRDNFS